MKACLQDICHLITDGKHGDCQNEEGSGYYFISCKDVKDGWIDYSGARQITEADYRDTHKRTQLEPNDILITNSGTIGRMALVPSKPETDRTTFQKSVAIIKPNSAYAVPQWLYYCLKARKDELIAWAGGTAQKNLLLRDLRAFKVQVFPLPTQRKIAGILSAYDDLIENNTRRIKILEEMAQRVYREWFVHFRYPDHENDKQVDSELGMIPEGWEVKQLGEKISFKRGKNITKKEIIPGDVPVVAAGRGPAYYHNQSNVAAPVVTISASGANAGYIRLYLEDIWASDCSYINKNTVRYIFYYYSLVKFRQVEITGLQRGSAQPHVYPKDLMRLIIVDAPEEIIWKFEDLSKPIFCEISNLRLKNNNLRQTRDLLLPKLISGELDVSQINIETGRANS